MGALFLLILYWSCWVCAKVHLEVSGAYTNLTKHQLQNGWGWGTGAKLGVYVAVFKVSAMRHTPKERLESPAAAPVAWSDWLADGLTAWLTFPEILWIRGAAACSRLESHCYVLRPHLRSCGGWTAFWIRFRSTGMQMAIHIAKCQSQTSDAKVMVGLISSWYSTELSMQLWNL